MLRTRGRWIGELGPALLFALTLGVPSVGLIQKYMGYGGVGLYLVGIAVSAAILRADTFLRLWRSVSETAAFWLLVAVLISVVIVVAIVHPIVDATKGDGNEALNIGARELFQGRYPYYRHTQLGNPIAPLPGAIFLAMPFVALSDSAYQNLFWLVLFAIFCRALFGSFRVSVLILATILLLSPSVIQGLILGGDRTANTLYVLLLSSLLVYLSTRDKRNDLLAAAAALLFGIALSSRGNFLFVIPFVFFTIAHRRGLRAAIGFSALTATTFLAATLPFYLYDRDTFGPTHSVTKLIDAFPHARLLVLGSAAAVSIVLSLNQSVSVVRQLAGCAVVQAMLFVSAVVLFALKYQNVQSTFVFMKEAYGVHFLFFGALAWWMRYGRLDANRRSRRMKGT
jgi:hypothetical protein